MNYILTFIGDLTAEVLNLFVEMAPYLLLGLSVVGILSVLVKKELIGKHIGGSGLYPVIKASLLGVPLPLCSCSVVPTARYLRQNGASRSSLISFLISTPQTGVDSIAATYGMLGPAFAVLRPVIALITGVIGGVAAAVVPPRKSTGTNPDISFPTETSQENSEQLTAPGEVTEKSQSGHQRDQARVISMKNRIRTGLDYAFIESIDDIAVQFVIGLIIAGLISLVIPDGFFEGTFAADGIVGMLLMVAIGIPMYVCSTSSIPIAVALIAKGISPGAAYVFLVAGPATNAATLIVLYKVLGLRHTLVYLLSIVAGALAFGPVVNLLASNSAIRTVSTLGLVDGHVGHGPLEYGLAVLLGVLLVLAFYRMAAERFGWPIRIGRISLASLLPLDTLGTTSSSDVPGNHLIRLEVRGMTCTHCAETVNSTLMAIPGVQAADVNLAGRFAILSGKFDSQEAIQALEARGYEAQVQE